MLRFHCNAIGRKMPRGGWRSSGGCLLLLVLVIPTAVVGQSDAARPGPGKLQFSIRSFEMIPMSHGPDDFRVFRRSHQRMPSALELNQAPTLPSFTLHLPPSSPTDLSEAMSPGPGDFKAFLRGWRTPQALEISPATAARSFAFQFLPSPSTDPLGAWRRPKLPRFVLNSRLFSNALVQGALKETPGQDLFRQRSEERNRRIGIRPYTNFRRASFGMRLSFRLSPQP